MTTVVGEKKANINSDDALSAYEPLLRRLLVNRGITNAAAAEPFLNPDYERHTHDPFLMKGMEIAVERIFRAMSAGEKIIIFSDYDADGIPGAVVFHDFLKKIGYLNFENYIPHRGNEGFGLNHTAIEEFAARGAKLLITIDCGIADGQEIVAAQTLGIDVIVTDHHEPSHGVPNACVVLDPKQPGCAYPDKNLCGSGVIFKLVQALCLHLRSHTSRLSPFNIQFPSLGWEKWLLDMVGLATLSDMVPLIGENRVFAYYGMKVLRKSPRPGLQQLLRKLRIKQATLTEDDVAFMITPRINAASRMGVPLDAFKLLSTSDVVEAGTYVDHLDKINNERKGIVGSMVKEVKKILIEREKEHSVIVIGNPLWKPSLLGLVANSLMKDHGKPVFLWGREGTGILKGSCRSDGSVSVVALMEAAKEVFIEYGGHELSGGFTIAEEHIHTVAEKLEKAFEGVRRAGQGGVVVVVPDTTLTLDEIHNDTFRLVDSLAPFGVGNKKPLFRFIDISPISVRPFGKEKNHLELQFENSVGEKITAIGFFQSADDWKKPIIPGSRFDLLATLEKSYFKYNPELRLRIVDII